MFFGPKNGSHVMNKQQFVSHHVIKMLLYAYSSRKPIYRLMDVCFWRHRTRENQLNAFKLPLSPASLLCCTSQQPISYSWTLSQDVTSNHDSKANETGVVRVLLDVIFEIISILVKFLGKLLLALINSTLKSKKHSKHTKMVQTELLPKYNNKLIERHAQIWNGVIFFIIIISW